MVWPPRARTGQYMRREAPERNENRNGGGDKWQCMENESACQITGRWQRMADGGQKTKGRCVEMARRCGKGRAVPAIRACVGKMERMSQENGEREGNAPRIHGRDLGATRSLGENPETDVSNGKTRRKEKRRERAARSLFSEHDGMDMKRTSDGSAAKEGKGGVGRPGRSDERDE